ncbi:MAG: hypothetical protein HFJ19_03745 [Clostridia bacterium]|nr:hypothetical protein [Clostridia bacterium]
MKATRKTIIRCFRFAITLGSFVSTVYMYRLLREILPNTRIDGGTLLMFIVIIVSVYIFIWSLPNFLRETWDLTKNVKRRIWKTIRKMKLI